ncbi:MAG TPA: hotdog fold thioesterase, partial [Pedococcus sp.]
MTQTDDTATALTPETLNANLGALAETMGIRFTEVTPQRLTATMPVEGNTQPYGLLHGGASAALAETIGSMLAVLLAGEGRVAVGIALNAIHHRAVREGTVTATAHPLHAGRTTATLAIEVTDEQDRRVCSATLVCQLRDAPPG